MWQINQPNPLGAYIEARQAGQQYQAGQQQMQQAQETHALRQQAGKQGMNVQQEALDQQRMEREREIWGEVGMAGRWVLGQPREGEPQTPQERLVLAQNTLRPILGDRVDSVTLDQLPMLVSRIDQELQGGAPAAIQTHDRLLQDLESPDPQVRRAAEIQLGITARAGGGGMQLVRIRGRDGRERIGTFNPQGGGLMIQTEQGWQDAGPGAQVIGSMDSVQPDMLTTRTPDEQAGATETATQQARTEAERERNVIPSYRAARYSIDQMAQFADTARTLLEHPGLEAATGFGGEQVSSIPGTDGYDAAAILDNLKNRAFLTALSALRQASQTGAGVGAVSEAEGMRFENAFVALDQAQSEAQFRRELETLIRIAEDSQSLIRDAYQFEYGGVPRAPALPEVGAPSARRRRDDDSPPEGIDPEDWRYMTPEERALWRN